jgi:chloramphenicol-sensitive protein RarD
MTPVASDDARAGVLVGIVAYTLWGLFPVYFKLLGEVAALDVLAWRIVLSALLLAVGMLLWSGPKRLLAKLNPGAEWPLVLMATLVISVNWLTFIVAVDEGQVLQSSLGYFLVPLVNSLLGVLVFAERPNRWKQASLVIAAVGLTVSFTVAGVVPWYALILALSFGLYGMLRKRMSLDSTSGLFLETLMLAPLAIAWLVIAGTSPAQYEPIVRNGLMLSGVVTVVPLLLMVFAVKRIELGTLGVLQYIAPAMHFVIAVAVYQEALNPSLTAAFITTVLAVGCWLLGSFRRPQVSTRTH